MPSSTTTRRLTAEDVTLGSSAASVKSPNGLYDTDSLRLALPWLLDRVEETWRVLGKEFWIYGLESHRNAWEALCRYQVEQQLAFRFVPADE